MKGILLIAFRDPAGFLEFNDLVEELDLSTKKSGVILASRLKQRNWVVPGVNVTYLRHRHRHETIAQFFF